MTEYILNILTNMRRQDGNLGAVGSLRTSNFTIKASNANQTSVTNLTLSGNNANITLQKKVRYEKKPLLLPKGMTTRERAIQF